MRFYFSSSDDPYYNLALEEYLLKQSTEDILLCYVNKPTLVLGRFQVPYAEVDVALMDECNVKIARRLSGGGTVYHDKGNLNYSYISNCSGQKANFYDIFNKKSTDVMSSLGLQDLTFQRNNIFCEGKKISGVAQYKRGERMVHHGTLLVDADLKQLRAIFTAKDYYTSKGVASVSSSVSNINEFIALEMKEVLLAFEESCIDKLGEVNANDQIVEMANYYATKEWVMGKSPKYSLTKDGFNLEVVNGRIASIDNNNYAPLVGSWHTYKDVKDKYEDAQLFF